MLKKLLKSIISGALGKKQHKHHYTSDGWKKGKYHSNSQYGHRHYKKMHRSSKFSSFFSS